jgi:hypothetical protein
MDHEPLNDPLATEERIRLIAYTLWEEEGQPEGRAELHWQRACEIVAAEAAEPGWLKRQEKPEVPKAAAVAEKPAAPRKVA